MIVCSPHPASMMKAALLSELTGKGPELRSPSAQQNLFSQLEEIDADAFSFNRLANELALKSGRDYRWIDGFQGRRIALMILFNLRNCSRDCTPVIFSALSEALRHGANYCISGRGKASSLFHRRGREVGTEIHRMLGLIRFTETAGGDLVARPKLYHHTADVLLRRFQLRYPARRLVFILEDGVLCCEEGHIRRIEMQDLPTSLLNPTDDFALMWETYYRSQYIESRKNIRLASHFIPKKYWDWLPEGKILEQEAKN